jgi:hypothetical protein
MLHESAPPLNPCPRSLLNIAACCMNLLPPLPLALAAYQQAPSPTSFHAYLCTQASSETTSPFALAVAAATSQGLASPSIRRPLSCSASRRFSASPSVFHGDGGARGAGDELEQLERGGGGEGATEEGSREMGGNGASSVVDHPLRRPSASPNPQVIPFSFLNHSLFPLATLSPLPRLSITLLPAPLPRLSITLLPAPLARSLRDEPPPL